MRPASLVFLRRSATPDYIGCRGGHIVHILKSAKVI